MSVITETKGRVKLQHLQDQWDESVAAGMDEPELLRYRSNLLGADLRITNFAGGNTSSKVRMADPLTGQQTDVLWVKGSGGDLGSIRRAGFATLYMDKLLALEKLYRGADREDEMVEYYPLCTFGLNPVAASIDTPLHGFLPFRHVDHLHPDCAIAVAAAANGIEKMEEFNRSHGHKLIWVPWQRPGFELAMMLKRAVEEQPNCDGIILGGHGLFTWGDTHRESYVNTISIIDELTTFVEKHQQKKGSGIFGGQHHIPLTDKKNVAVEILPFLRGRVSSQRRLIGNYSDLPEVLEFANSHDAERLAYLGTSCPDHFIRTKIRPMYVLWNPSSGIDELKKAIDERIAVYRTEYAEYYKEARRAHVAGHARSESHRSFDSRHRHVQLRQEQAGSADYGRAVYECDSRDEGRGRARGRVRSRLRSRSAGRRPSPKPSRSTATTSRCPSSRPIASSTGCSKTRRFAGSRQRRN